MRYFYKLFLHSPPLPLLLSPTAPLLSLSPHSFCTASLMWHFQEASLKLLSHRTGPIKSVAHLDLLFHNKTPIYLLFFSCFSASVESVQIRPKSATFEMPVRSLQMKAWRNKKKVKIKKIKNLSALFPLLVGFPFWNATYICMLFWKSFSWQVLPEV